RPRGSRRGNGGDAPRSAGGSNGHLPFKRSQSYQPGDESADGAGNDCSSRHRNLGLLRDEHQRSSLDRISARDGDCGGSDDRDYGGAAYCTEEVRLVLTAAIKFAERKNRWERAAHTTYQR